MILAPVLILLFLMSYTILPMATFLVTQERTVHLQKTQLQLQAGLEAEFQRNRAAFMGMSRPPFPTSVTIVSAFSKEAIKPTGMLYKLHIVAKVPGLKKERSFWTIMKDPDTPFPHPPL